MAVPPATAARDVALEVKPRRIRVAARGCVLLEGALGGEVRAADAGDWEWELADASGDAEEGGRVLAVTLAKRCVPARGSAAAAAELSGAPAAWCRTRRRSSGAAPSRAQGTRRWTPRA